MKKIGSLLIIGGGIIGLTTAREAIKSGFFKKVLLIEKEDELGFHASRRNSGVIHAGFYYDPNSQKGKFCSDANKLMREYCMKNGIPINKCGKVVVTRNSSEINTLELLYERGKRNNCNVELLLQKDLKYYEPLAKTVDKFLWSPNTWSASPKALIDNLEKELIELGVDIIYSSKIIGASNNYIIDQKGRKYFYDVLINNAGGYCLEIAKLLGLKTNYEILPFKGLYLKSKHVFRNFSCHIYPVPNIETPFLGIHTTLTFDKFLKLGPTALPAFSPENYSLFEGIDMSLFPKILATQSSLFIKNNFKFRDLALREISFLNKSIFIEQAQKLTNYKLMANLFEWYSPGIRPQLLNKKNNSLEMDFIVLNNDNKYHLINSISPAWTCSFQTAKHIIQKIIK